MSLFEYVAHKRAMYSSYTLRSETTVVLRCLGPGIEAAQGNNPPSNWEAVIVQQKTDLPRVRPQI